jgi:hypothetical protein
VKLDLADWHDARQKLITRIEAGAWRHGIKTKDAIREVIRYGAFPSDPSTMWPVKWRKKNGQLVEFFLYYFVQSGLKNRNWSFRGASGRCYRLRRIYCVEHGVAEGEEGPNGEPLRPAKEGIWLREEDMSRIDVAYARTMYRDRETDSSANKIFLTEAYRVLSRKQDDSLIVGDVLDEIARAM